MARKYNVKNEKGESSRNGGQIIKEWLKTKLGVDINRFKRKHGETGRIVENIL